MAAVNEENTNFARVSCIVLDLFTDVLRNLVLSIHQPSTPIKLNFNLKPKFKLTAKQSLTISNIPVVGNYDACDTTLLCVFIRNLCSKIVPTHGWKGNVMPAPVDLTVGDDVVRMRCFRNDLYGHIHSAVIDNVTYTQFLQDAWNILNRFDNCHGG